MNPDFNCAWYMDKPLQYDPKPLQYVSRLPMPISCTNPAVAHWLIRLFYSLLSLCYIRQVQSMFRVKKRQPNMSKTMFYIYQKLHSYLPLFAWYCNCIFCSVATLQTLVFENLRSTTGSQVTTSYMTTKKSKTVLPKLKYEAIDDLVDSHGNKSHIGWPYIIIWLVFVDCSV